MGIQFHCGGAVVALTKPNATPIVRPINWRRPNTDLAWGKIDLEGPFLELDSRGVPYEYLGRRLNRTERLDIWKAAGCPGGTYPEDATAERVTGDDRYDRYRYVHMLSRWYGPKPRPAGFVEVELTDEERGYVSLSTGFRAGRSDLMTDLAWKIAVAMMGVPKIGRTA